MSGWALDRISDYATHSDLEEKGELEGIIYSENFGAVELIALKIQELSIFAERWLLILTPRTSGTETEARYYSVQMLSNGIVTRHPRKGSHTNFRFPWDGIMFSVGFISSKQVASFAYICSRWVVLDRFFCMWPIFWKVKNGLKN